MIVSVLKANQSLSTTELVYDPKPEGLKLHPKWIAPILVINKSEHLYKVQFQTYKGLKIKCLPIDRLRKTNNIPLTYIENDVKDDHTNTEHIQHDSKSSDDDNIVQRRQQRERYNLRPRGIQRTYRVNLF